MEPIQLKRVDAQFCGSIQFEGGHMQSFSPGPDGLLYILICMGEPDQNWIERENPCDWRVLAFHREGWCSEQVIRRQRRNYSAIQPLREGVILASPRCKFEGNTTLPNGHIFDKDGQLVRQILLGDGIEQLQTTKSGEIWASYFDEGILGNSGSLGESGLNRFDESGKITYRFDPPAGLESMFDCYCLNVTSDREDGATTTRSSRSFASTMAG